MGVLAGAWMGVLAGAFLAGASDGAWVGVLAGERGRGRMGVLEGGDLPG